MVGEGWNWRRFLKFEDDGEGKWWKGVFIGFAWLQPKWDG